MASCFHTFVSRSFAWHRVGSPSAWAWLLAVASLVATPPAEARTLRVLTYNIHHSEGRDGVFNLNRIAEVINAANPDVVALQELDQGNMRSGVNVFQLNELAQLTGTEGVFGKTIDYQGGAYGNGVLLRSNLHMTHVVNRPMPSPVGGETRGLLEIGVSLDGANAAPEFHFFATHFTASSDEASRMAQAAFINSLVAPSNLPALVGGDFNARPSSPVMLRMGEEWTDPTTLNPAAPRASQIDYVLYRGTDRWRVVEEGNFIVSFKTQVASDHYPYLVVIQSVPEPQALSMIGLCGGLMVMLGRPSVSTPRFASDQSPMTPPRANGKPWGAECLRCRRRLGDLSDRQFPRAANPTAAKVRCRNCDSRARRRANHSATNEHTGARGALADSV